MTVGFHRQDHSPFAGFGVGLAYSKRPDGSIITIAQAAKGKACDCVCPACGEDLVAKKGPKTADHFAHAATGEGGCGLGAETNAHLWAKAVLEELKEIRLPAIEGRVGDRKHQTHRSRTYRFIEAVLEKRLGEIVPDVILIAADGRRLLVEVFVTHACGEEKIAKIRAGAVSAIEVDLSAYKTEGSEAAVRNALLRTAPRTWLFNPAVDQAEAELKAVLEREARDAAKTARRHARRAAERIRSAAPRLTDALKAERDAVIALGLNALILAPAAPDDGFVVPSSIWRAALIRRLVLQRSGTRLGMLWPIEDDEPMRTINDCLAPGVLAGHRAPTPRAMKAALPGFIPPQETVDRFLDALRDHGLLVDTRDGLLVNRDARDALLEREAAQQAAARRSREAEDLLGGLFDIAVVDRQGGSFSLRTWRRSVPDFNRAFSDIVEEGDADWSRMRRSLQAIGEMLRGGAPCDNLVGLPFEAEQEIAVRQAEAIVAQEAFAAAERAREAGEDRLRRAKARASRIDRFDVEAWFRRPARSSPLTPEDAARRDDQGLALVMNSLDRIEAEWRQELAREAEAADCRARLEIAAEKSFEDERLKLFLHTHRRELGMQSPWAFSVDAKRLKEALRLLPGAGSRRS